MQPTLCSQGMTLSHLRKAGTMGFGKPATTLNKMLEELEGGGGDFEQDMFGYNDDYDEIVSADPEQLSRPRDSYLTLPGDAYNWP